ncbi:MAG: type II CAAX endopeptidase family protein [Chloroflexi bacterium]|nr:type II CAAX endopeptidase family protein [Chloroflexota bacterium]
MQDVLVTVLLFLPLVFLLWLANLAERRRTAVEGQADNALGVITMVLLGAFLGIFVLLGIILGVLGLLAQAQSAAATAVAAAGLDPASFGKMGLAMWASALLGIVLLLPPVRRLLARLIPMDPRNTVHAVALSYSALILMNLLVTLGLGLRNLSALMESGGGAQSNPMPGLWAQDVTLAFMALVGVGWLSRQGIRGALQRLGVGRLSLRRLFGGIGIGLGLVPLVLALEWLTRQVGIPSDADVERLTEQLIGPLTQSLPGILTLGLAAALGEESIFRGALQPRFGLLFTTVLFALLHSQYGISVSTLLVFIVGLVLGIVRTRANTTTTMLIHAIYNMALGLITYLGVMQNV